MSPLSHYRTLARYNRWMNARLYALCAELPDAERRRDLGAYFRSIHGTLNHILLADRVWMARYTGGQYAVSGLDQELYAAFAELRAAREREDGRILAWVEALGEADLAGELSYTGIARPEPRRYPLWFALAHFFNHQTHHRGQVTTLLHQLGVDPGVTDLIALPAELRVLP